MRILLLGNTGQLGWELERTLAPLGELNACDYPAIDLADIQSLRQLIQRLPARCAGQCCRLYRRGPG